MIEDNFQRNVFHIEDELNAPAVASQKKPRKKKGGKHQQVELPFYGGTKDSQIPNPKYKPNPKEEHKTQYKNSKQDHYYQEAQTSGMQNDPTGEEHPQAKNKYAKKKHDKDKQNKEQQRQEEEQKEAKRVLQ